MNYQTAIRETPAIRVAALPHLGAYNQIAATFEQLAAIAASMNLSGPSTNDSCGYHGALDAGYAHDRYLSRRSSLRATEGGVLM